METERGPGERLGCSHGSLLLCCVWATSRGACGPWVRQVGQGPDHHFPRFQCVQEQLPGCVLAHDGYGNTAPSCFGFDLNCVLCLWWFFRFSWVHCLEENRGQQVTMSEATIFFQFIVFLYVFTCTQLTPRWRARANTPDVIMVTGLSGLFGRTDLYMLVSCRANDGMTT